MSIGQASIMKRIEVLSAAEYRQALTYYNVNSSNDKGGNVNALDAILRNATVQNYNVAVSGGNESAKYRLFWVPSTRKVLFANQESRNTPPT